MLAHPGVSTMPEGIEREVIEREVLEWMGLGREVLERRTGMQGSDRLQPLLRGILLVTLVRRQ